MQFDQVLSQLIDWLKEKSQQAILWLQHFDFNPDVSQLKEVLGKGWEDASLWLHLVGVSFAFTSDFLKPLFPRFTLKLALGGATFPLLPALGIKFHIIPEELGAAIIVFCLLTAVLSSVMLVLQRGHKHGALAELIPGVKGLLKQLFAVKQDTEALLEAQRQEKARAEQRQTEVLKGQEESKAGIKEIKGLLAPALGGGGSEKQALLEIRRVLRPNVPNMTKSRPRNLPLWCRGFLTLRKSPPPRPKISPVR